MFKTYIYDCFNHTSFIFFDTFIILIYDLLRNSILGGATSDKEIKYFIQSLNLPEREKYY